MLRTDVMVCTVTTTGCLRLPALYKLHGWGGEQAVWHKANLLHDVGQPDGQLLSQEGERGLLAGVRGAY